MLRIEIAFLAMAAIIVTSNALVLFPINDWLTWGAFPYVISFLITELCVQLHGPKLARRVVYAGFAVGVAISIWLATPRIALASGTAFLVSQLLDIALFSRLRRYAAWWLAPLSASLLASTVDSAMFWTLAFYGEGLPYITWAVGDACVKFAVDVIMLLPFRLALYTQPLMSKKI